MKPISQGAYLDWPAGHWLAALSDDDPLARRLAAYALGEIGPAAEEASAALLAALEDPASFVRVWAAAALARVCPGHPAVVPALVAGMKDERAFVRSLAVWHLGRLGSAAAGLEGALPEMQRLLADGDPSVQVEADLALKRLRKQGQFLARGAV
jgi:HEAT repeat protein